MITTSNNSEAIKNEVTEKTRIDKMKIQIIK